VTKDPTHFSSWYYRWVHESSVYKGSGKFESQASSPSRSPQSKPQFRLDQRHLRQSRRPCRLRQVRYRALPPQGVCLQAREQARCRALTLQGVARHRTKATLEGWLPKGFPRGSLRVLGRTPDAAAPYVGSRFKTLTRTDGGRAHFINDYLYPLTARKRASKVG